MRCCVSSVPVCSRRRVAALSASLCPFVHVSTFHVTFHVTSSLRHGVARYPFVPLHVIPSPLRCLLCRVRVMGAFPAAVEPCAVRRRRPCPVAWPGIRLPPSAACASCSAICLSSVPSAAILGVSVCARHGVLCPPNDCGNTTPTHCTAQQQKPSQPPVMPTPAPETPTHRCAVVPPPRALRRSVKPNAKPNPKLISLHITSRHCFVCGRVWCVVIRFVSWPFAVTSMAQSLPLPLLLLHVLFSRSRCLATSTPLKAHERPTPLDHPSV